jgi:hypothetical protein
MVEMKRYHETSIKKKKKKKKEKRKKKKKSSICSYKIRHNSIYSCVILTYQVVGTRNT